jgi:hypothetical protein
VSLFPIPSRFGEIGELGEDAISAPLVLYCLKLNQSLQRHRPLYAGDPIFSSKWVARIALFRATVR